MRHHVAQKIDPDISEDYCLHPQGTIEAAVYSGTLIPTQQITWQNIPEGHILTLTAMRTSNLSSKHWTCNAENALYAQMHLHCQLRHQ